MMRALGGASRRGSQLVRTVDHRTEGPKATPETLGLAPSSRGSPETSLPIRWVGPGPGPPGPRFPHPSVWEMPSSAQEAETLRPLPKAPAPAQRSTRDGPEGAGVAWNPTLHSQLP